MKVIGLQSCAELRDFFSALGNGYLFRGQTRDFVDADGISTLTTSFFRKGCHPPHMLRWSHYARSILQTFAKGFDDAEDLATDQAILQHYGWRSFFIDATSDPAVACWFASHKFTSKPRIELTEDCWEDGVFIVRDAASYQPIDDLVVVYCLSKKKLRAHDLQQVDLNEIATAAGRPRFLAQSAWMVGPLRFAIPPDCITAKILAPASVFREHALAADLRDEHVLFPGPNEDPVLAALLSTPFLHQDARADAGKLQFYVRSLPLPEYGWQFQKIQPASVAFYRPFWLANECQFGEAPFAEATFLLSPESMFYGRADNTRWFPRLNKLMTRHPAIVAEMDGLMRHPHASPNKQYGKGISIERLAKDLVHVGEIALYHPGRRPAECGLVRGRHYRVDSSGAWTPEKHSDDCPCGNDSLHAHHLVVVAHLEEELAGKKFKRLGPHIMAHADIDPTLNLSHLKDSKALGVPYFSD